MFSLRIVSTSHYEAEPVPDLDVLYSTFRCNDVWKVPVLRIFGATPSGQKTCMHVHGVFPYLFVPYDGTQPLEGYLRRFAASLDKALNVANNSNMNKQHVFKISLVSGLPMYGYHAQEQQFLKIYLYNPKFIRKASDLLLGGAVMNKCFQPHEAHIPFPLQLFIDYNLYGMNLINVAAVKFRRQKATEGDETAKSLSISSKMDDSSPEDYDGLSTPSFMRTPTSSAGSMTNTPCMTFWDVGNIPSELLLTPSVERQSQCELEVDVVAADILNRRDVTDNMGSNPGLAALWEDERQRRRDVGQATQITPKDSQEHKTVESSASEQKLLERLAEIVRQQSALRRSESEESAASMEDTTLTPDDSVCIPASQLEDHHSLSTLGSKQWSQSGDKVMVVGEDEREGDDEDAVISLESIHRVVSFSQSFSRPNSQPTASQSGNEDAEAADRSLADLLASLAEESSSSSSQRSAAQMSALEERDSVIGQEVSLPPDEAALQEDEEETLLMSQTLPQDRGNYDLEGLDATWNGSSGDEDCPMESDGSDEDSIPQLDGTSDEKKASKKSKKSKKVTTVETGSGETTVPSQGDVGSPHQHYTASLQGPAGSGMMPSFSQQPSGIEGQGHVQSGQPQQGYYGYQQWGEGSSSQAGGLSLYPGHSSQSSSGWNQSPSHPVSGYPGMYRPAHPGNSANYGYYYAQQQQQRFSYGRSGAVGRGGGPQSSPQQTFSPPPAQLMASPTYPGSFPRPQPGSSPQYNAYVAHSPGLSGMRRHSEGSMPAQQGQGWQQYPGQGYANSAKSPMSSPESWTGGPSYPGSNGGQQVVGGGGVGSGSTMGPGQFGNTGGNQLGQQSGGVTSGHKNRHTPSSGSVGSQTLMPSTLSTSTSTAMARSDQMGHSPEEDGNTTGQSGEAQMLSQLQPSTLQALLEAPESSRVTHTQTSGPQPRRAASMDYNAAGPSLSPAQLGPSDSKHKFKYPEKRSSSFSMPGCGMAGPGALMGGGMIGGPMGVPASVVGGGLPSALTNLYNFVSNVDSTANNRTPTPTSHSSTPTSNLTPSSTPTPSTGPSPMQEDMVGFIDGKFGLPKQPPIQQQHQSAPFQQRLPPSRSLSMDEGTSFRSSQGRITVDEGAIIEDLQVSASLSPLCQNVIKSGDESPSNSSNISFVEIGPVPSNPSVSMTTSSSQTTLSSSQTTMSTSAAAASGKLGRQNRGRKLGLTLNRSGRQVSEDKGVPSGSPQTTPATPTPCAAYTFTFHVPTPVYKRFKMRGSILFPLRHSADIRLVRMHPMDARRYSLLKIGRELVRLKRLTPEELRLAMTSSKERSVTPEDHQSLIDPATGEFMTSFPGREPEPKPSQSLCRATKMGSPRRLLGPKCKRLKAAAANNGQAPGEVVTAVKTEADVACGSDGPATSWSGSAEGPATNTIETGGQLGNAQQMFQAPQAVPRSCILGQTDLPANTGLQSNMPEPANVICESGMPGHASVIGQSGMPGHASVIGESGMPGLSGIPAQSAVPGQVGMPGQPVVGENGGPAWQTMDRDRRPSVKVEYPAQRQGQWAGVQPQDAWSQGSSPNFMSQGSNPGVVGPSQQQWGGQYGQQGWSGVSMKGGQHYGYSQMTEACGAVQQQSPGQFGYSAWPASSPAYSSASSSGPNPMPSVSCSPTDGGKGMGSPTTYPNPYQQQNYNTYHGQYNHGYSHHNKFGYPGMGPQRYSYQGYGEQSSGYHPQGYVNQQGMHNQYQQQGQFMQAAGSGGGHGGGGSAGGSTSGTFQHNGGFSSPHHNFSPSPSSCGQYPAAASSSCTTSTSTAVQPPHFPSPTGQPGQFPSPSQAQQGQYPTQQQAGSFGQPTAQFSSSSTAQAGLFPTSSPYTAGQFSPSGDVSGQYPQMCPQMGYQGHFSPSNNQQFFPQQDAPPGQGVLTSLSGQQNSYSAISGQQGQYPGSFHSQGQFTSPTQGMAGNVNGGMSPSSNTSQHSSNSGATQASFLDTAKPSQPFLTQAACQAPMSSASETQGETQSGRPTVTSIHNPPSSPTQQDHLKEDKAELQTPHPDTAADTKDVSKSGKNKSAKNSVSDIGDKNAAHKKNSKGRIGSSVSSDTAIANQSVNISASKLSPNIRHSSVQLWSDGDSDSEEDNSVDADEDSDEYRPTSKLRYNGQKRRGSRQKSPTQNKRAKRSSVDYGSRIATRLSDVDGGQRLKGRSFRPRKNYPNDMKGGKRQTLIEGVHYIVVGKFKGHKVMLVKVSRVQVKLNERVKVSELQRGEMKDQGQLKVRGRLLGPRCKRMALGTAASDPSFVQESDKRSGSESESEKLAVKDSDINSKQSNTGNSNDPKKDISAGRNDKSEKKESGKRSELKGHKKENNGKCSSIKGNSDGKGDRKDEDDEDGTSSGDKAVTSNHTKGGDQVKRGDSTKTEGKCSDDSKTTGDKSQSENTKSANTKKCAIKAFSGTKYMKGNKCAEHEMTDGPKSVAAEDTSDSSTFPDLTHPKSDISPEDRDKPGGKDKDVEAGDKMSGNSTEKIKGGAESASNVHSKTQSADSESGKGHKDDSPFRLIKYFQDAAISSLLPSCPDSPSPLSHSTALDTCRGRGRWRGRPRSRRRLTRRKLLKQFDPLRCKDVIERDSSGLTLGLFSLQTAPDGESEAAVQEQRHAASDTDVGGDLSGCHARFSPNRTSRDSSHYGDRDISSSSRGESSSDRDSRGNSRDDNCSTGRVSSGDPTNINGNDRVFSSSAPTQPKAGDDKLKKQKFLTTNQRLGVAFVSKRRRKRNRLKFVSKIEKCNGEIGSSRSKDTDCYDTRTTYVFAAASAFSTIRPPSSAKAFNFSSKPKLSSAFCDKPKTFCKIKKVSSATCTTSSASSSATSALDSLALLHMATLASLEECSTNAVAAGDLAEEKENRAGLSIPTGTVLSEEWRTCSSQWETRAHTPPSCDMFSKVCDPEMACEVKLDDVFYLEKKRLASASRDQNKKEEFVCGVGEVGVFASVSLCKLNTIDKEKSQSEDSKCPTNRIEQENCKENSAHGEVCDKKHECEEKAQTVAKQDKLLVASDKHPDKRKCAEKAMMSIEQQLFEDSEESLDGRGFFVDTKPSEDFDDGEETVDYTLKSSVTRPATKRLSGCRAKGRGVTKKPVSGRTNRQFDSLHCLHVATLASLGSEQPGSRDVCLPRYCDLATDHMDIYEESLIRMSYTSPVHSDLGDLSPPVPLSPEVIAQRQVGEKRDKNKRPMPFKPKVNKIDAARGTRIVFMSQVRAENAAVMEAMAAPPPILLKLQALVKSETTEEREEGSVIEDTPPSKRPSLVKLNTSSNAHGTTTELSGSLKSLGLSKLLQASSGQGLSGVHHQPSCGSTGPSPALVAGKLERSGPYKSLDISIADLCKLQAPLRHTRTASPHLPSSDPSKVKPDLPDCRKPHLPAPYHSSMLDPSMLDPSRFPIPDVPWNRPLHIFTEGGDGAGAGAWKDRVIHDALTEKHNFSSSLDIGEKTSPYLPYSQHDRDSQEDCSEFSSSSAPRKGVLLKTPLCSAGGVPKISHISCLSRTTLNTGQKLTGHLYDGKVTEHVSGVVTSGYRCGRDESSQMPPPPPYPNMSKCARDLNSISSPPTAALDFTTHNKPLPFTAASHTSQLHTHDCPGKLSPRSSNRLCDFARSPSLLSSDRILSSLSSDRIPSSLSTDKIHSSLSTDKIHSSLSSDRIPSSLSSDKIPSLLSSDRTPSLPSRDRIPSLSNNRIPSSLSIDRIASLIISDRIPSSLSNDRIPLSLSSDRIDRHAVFSPRSAGSVRSNLPSQSEHHMPSCPEPMCPKDLQRHSGLSDTTDTRQNTSGRDKSSRDQTVDHLLRSEPDVAPERQNEQKAYPPSQSCHRYLSPRGSGISRTEKVIWQMFNLNPEAVSTQKTSSQSHKSDWYGLNYTRPKSSDSTNSNTSCGTYNDGKPLSLISEPVSPPTHGRVENVYTRFLPGCSREDRADNCTAWKPPGNQRLKSESPSAYTENLRPPPPYDLSRSPAVSAYISGRSSSVNTSLESESILGRTTSLGRPRDQRPTSQSLPGKSAVGLRLLEHDLSQNERYPEDCATPENPPSGNWCPGAALTKSPEKSAGFSPGAPYFSLRQKTPPLYGASLLRTPPARTASGAERSLSSSSSESPVYLSPASVHSTSGKSTSLSPRQAVSDSTRPNRKRSIAEYLEEVIESTYAELISDDKKAGSAARPAAGMDSVSKQSSQGQASGDRRGKTTGADLYRSASEKHTYGSQTEALNLVKMPATSEFNDLRSLLAFTAESASGRHDGSLGAASRSFGQSTGTSSSQARSYHPAYSSFTASASSSVPVNVPRSCYSQGVAGASVSSASAIWPSTSTVPNLDSFPVPSTTQTVNRPIWTSIKTDNFENITDDEDEDIIPSSQEAPVHSSQELQPPPASHGYLQRFPGFSRLSSISTIYTPYSLQQGSYVFSFPRHSSSVAAGGGTVKDPTEGARSESSSHGHSSSTTSGYHFSSKGLYGVSRGEVATCDSSAKTGRSSSCEGSRQQCEAQDLVTSFGTQWRDTQPSTIAHVATPHVSQFEPITDSEGEEDAKDKWQEMESKSSPGYRNRYSACSRFFPVYTSAPSQQVTVSNSADRILSQGEYTYRTLPGSWSSSSSKLDTLDLTTAKANLRTEATDLYGVGLTLGVSEGGKACVDKDKRSALLPMTSNTTVDTSSGKNGRMVDCGSTSSFRSTSAGGWGDDQPQDGGSRKRKRSGNHPRGGGGDSSPDSTPPASASSGGSSPSSQRGQHFDKSRDPNKTGPGADSDPGGMVRSRHTLCPRAPPPSRASVEASAVNVGLSIEPVTRAFCSHPADLPDRPRELGGRVLRIASYWVRDLEEFSSPPSGDSDSAGWGMRRSLQEWQSMMAADSALLSTQTCHATTALTTPIAERLQLEPQLRYAITGDLPCVLVPVAPPPSFSAVTAWLEGKLRTISQRQLGSTDSGVKSVKMELGLAGESVDPSMPDDIDVPVEEIEYDEGGRACSEDESEGSEFTRLRDRLASREEAAGPSSPKRRCLAAEGLLHSTPARSSTELFESGYTPITCAQRGVVVEGDTGIRSPATDGREGAGNRKEESGKECKFETPKRPPLRRLSTNTQTALRHALHEARHKLLEGEMSQIDGPTPKNSHGFKVTQQKLQDAKALHKHQYLTVMSTELHTDSRGDLMPDPEVDAIRVIFYAVFDDIPPEKGRRKIVGAIVVDKDSCSGRLDNSAAASSRAISPSLRKGSERGHSGPGASVSCGHGRGESSAIPETSTSRLDTAGLPPRVVKGKSRLLDKCGLLEELDLAYVTSELELLHTFSRLVASLDPDILLGFEVQELSWGFLLKRAAQLGVNLCAQISRIHSSKQGNRFSAEKDEWGADHSSEIHVEGRIVLNLWRVLRHEVTLNIYSYENCAYHILHRRVPVYTFRSLTSWYDHRTHLHRWRVIGHYVERVTGQLAILDQLDIIGKTSEFARVFGIEFYDVLTRGSQYRVESMMLRLAKPLNFIPVSPGMQQRARQKASECIQLTLEPESRFYTDPVVVLDFQSLYPSIMIAYNYCFSTCLGRLEHLAKAHEGPIEFGCTSLSLSPETLKKLRKHVTVSPNGCVFITSKVRRGVLPLMVEEILKTRLMVKKSMKDYKNDKTLHRMLDARQLGLKLIANVTFGYTNASYSGRMPCIEVADSIVRKARESLERAIQLVEDMPHWRARVVYGDTDSLFIHLPGRTKDQAFAIGNEIADTITDMFPKPMKLRFEKVYLPCALQTKKRYVGFMYETSDQKEPAFDAKGIETVRRDNCAVVSKVLERSIKILFTTRNLSRVRAYLQRQLGKMMAGRVGLQDYIFAKEYRGMMGYKPGSCVPALEIARKRLREDRRSEPRVGERVPYVIVHGSPGLPLIQLVRQPLELLRDTTLRVNVTYYISKQVLPPLDRLLGLAGVSVFQWYADMPKVVRIAPHLAPAHETKQGTISQYFVTSNCLVCEQQTKQAVCAECLKDPQVVAFTLASKATAWESVYDKLSRVCVTCMGAQDQTQPCVSLDCPVLFRRHVANCDLVRTNQVRDALLKADLSF